MTPINCDMGEGYGIWSLGDEAGLMPSIHIANVACGFHASDFTHMRATVRLAKQHSVKVGTHPSLPDRQGFGRRGMKMECEEIANCVIYQIGALKAGIYVERGHRFFREVNLDLDYMDEGTLIVTRHHAAVDLAAAAVRALSAPRDGTVTSVGIDTMCIHCDTPGAAPLEADHLHQPYRRNAVQPVIRPPYRRPR